MAKRVGTNFQPHLRRNLDTVNYRYALTGEDKFVETVKHKGHMGLELGAQIQDSQGRTIGYKGRLSLPISGSVGLGGTPSSKGAPRLVYAVYDLDFHYVFLKRKSSWDDLFAGKISPEPYDPATEAKLTLVGYRIFKNDREFPYHKIAIAGFRPGENGGLHLDAMNASILVEPGPSYDSGPPVFYGINEDGKRYRVPVGPIRYGQLNKWAIYPHFGVTENAPLSRCGLQKNGVVFNFPKSKFLYSDLFPEKSNSIRETFNREIQRNEPPIYQLESGETKEPHLRLDPDLSQ